MTNHNKNKPMFRPALLASAIALIVSGSAFAEKASFYSEANRATAKLIITPIASPSKEMNQDLARAYINDQHSRFGISKAQNLRFTHQRESLLGTHYYFQQFLGKVPVDQAEMIVTIGKDGHTISKVYNSTHQTTPQLERAALLNVKPGISGDKAIDNAWNILQVRDQLTSAPRSELVYFVDNKGQFHLTHRVHIAAQGDTGGRMMYIDANRGNLVHDHSTTLRRHGDMPTIAQLNQRKGPVLSRQLQSKRFENISAASATQGVLASATALVFDPDPRTTLEDKSLEDNSPASSFTAAYLTRTLQGLNLSGGVYSMDGAYVNIKEIENPKTAPSTSSDGTWTAVRGDNAFNDATTYFQLDQSQRYMQSLGFVGATGIIERPLDVDTDGVSGADNSHYSYGGSSDYLAFGHGDVDDNEDA
ncbi:MAG: hypothetical protein HRT35_08755, partial [Algicola sp.]|nr:hypothetical protein [Algicola sp.]